MGKEPNLSSGLAAALFSSVQQRVLAPLFMEPDRTFSTSEMIRIAGSGTGAVHRELRRLAESGLVTVIAVGNQKRYQANARSPIFDELHRLILKTIGLAWPLREALMIHADKIQAAFVYGSIARGSDTSNSDVDLLVISDHLTYAELFAALQDAERRLRRKISPSLMTPADWKRKRQSRNSFLEKVNRQPKLFVLGSEDDLPSARQPRQNRQPKTRTSQPG
jgi:predicted nucleotidyltransferase